MISRQLTEVNVWVYVCTYSLALPSKGLRSRDIPVTMSIPTAQILASKYDYPLKETKRSLEKELTLVLGQGKYKISLGHLVKPKKNEVLQK